MLFQSDIRIDDHNKRNLHSLCKKKSVNRNYKYFYQNLESRNRGNHAIEVPFYPDLSRPVAKM